MPPVPQWTTTHDLAKMTSQNDFQSICKLALTHAPVVSEESKSPMIEKVDKCTLLISPPTSAPTPAPLMKRVDEENLTSSMALGRFVHFLRCSFCGLESINKTRFDSHLPCSQKVNPSEHYYLLHTCSACLACSTSQDLMDEHIDLFHKGTRVCTLSVFVESIFLKYD